MVLASPSMAAPDIDDGLALLTLEVPGPLGDIIRPLRRTGRYYARSWREYLERQPGELPIREGEVATDVPIEVDQCSILLPATSTNRQTDCATVTNGSDNETPSAAPILPSG